MDHAFQGRMREASQLASEAWALIESIGDPTLTVGLSFAAIYAKIETAEWPDVLRWSQTVIDLADGDPSKGNFIFGSPLAVAFATRASPGIAWAVPDGATTCGTASPWPAAPTPCPTPRSSRCVYGPANTVLACCWPDDRRDARDRGCPADCRTIR